MTRDGIRRDRDVQRSDSSVAISARKLDYVIIAMLAVTVSMLWFDMPGAPANDGSADLVVNEQPSIAVLPFENRGADPADVFFFDGIHDDILTSLA